MKQSTWKEKITKKNVYDENASSDKEDISSISKEDKEEKLDKEEKPDKEEKSLDDSVLEKEAINSATSYSGHSCLMSNGEEAQPNESIKEFSMRTSYSGHDSSAHKEEKTSRNSNKEEGSVTIDSVNHPSNAREAE
eukprot:3763846-Ditylum_brightwellii.AAC.1